MKEIYQDNYVKMPSPKLKRRKRSKAISPSLGLVIPFQPSLWDKNLGDNIINYSKKITYSKLKNSYCESIIKKILIRLDNVFRNLNFISHRKSLAIILNPEKESIVYLNYPVKPAVISGKSVSLLDLLTFSQLENSFYLFVLQDGKINLFERDSKNIHIIYEESGVQSSEYLFKNAMQVIDMVNAKNKKPVFVTGLPRLVKTFCNSGSLSKINGSILFPLELVGEDLKTLIDYKIDKHWQYWQSKYLSNLVLSAKNSGTLFSTIDTVISALKNKKAGFLLVDKTFSEKLNRLEVGGSLKNFIKETLGEVEKFINRGNRVIVTEISIIKNNGGIALISNHD